MNILDFKKWLDQFPDDTVVQVMVNNYHLDFKDHSYDFSHFIDLTNNEFVNDPSLQKKFLKLGSESDD